MKILVVSNGYPPRGSFGTEFYTREMVRGLLDRGHEVRVLHPVRDGERPRYSMDRVTVEGVPVHLLSNAGDPDKGFLSSYVDERVEHRFGELLEVWRPDLIHFTYLLWGLSVRLPRVAREAGIPTVLTLTDYGLVCHRGQMFDAHLERCEGPHPARTCARCIRTPSVYDFGPIERTGRRVVARLMARVGGLGNVVVDDDLEEREREVKTTLDGVGHVIAPTEVIARPFRALGLTKERLSILPYAFDESPYEPARTSPVPEVPRLVYFGQFAPHKGVDVLIDAVRALEARRGDTAWEVVLYGGPSVGRHARFGPAMVRRLKGTRCSIGDAFRPGEAPGVLSQATALVVPSRWDENAPLAVLEARAAGIPVLASDVEGIACIVEEGVHGGLFERDDAGSLATLMERAIDGEFPRSSRPGLPMSLAAHLDRLEAIYAETERSW